MVGPSLRQRVGKGVAAGKRAGADGVEAVPFEAGAKLGKGIVKAAVAECHDRHGKRAASGKAGFDKFKQLVGELSRISRHSEDNKVPLGKSILFLARGGQRKVAHLQRDLKADGKGVGKGRCDLAGIAGSAEIDCIDLRDIHAGCLLSIIFGALPGRYREKSSAECLPLKLAGRGGMRLSGS